MNKQEELSGMRMVLGNYLIDHGLCELFSVYQKAGEVLCDAGYGNVLQARKEMAKEIFTDMYKLVNRAEGSVVTVTCSDIKAIARKCYGVEIEVS